MRLRRAFLLACATAIPALTLVWNLYDRRDDLALWLWDRTT